MKLSIITIPKAIIIMVLGMLAWSVGNAHAQIVERLPRLAYVYPAGGQQGTTIEVLVGGQFLQGCSQVHVNAPGVTGKIVEKYRPLRLFSLEKEQREEMHRRLVTLVQLRWEEMHKQGLVDGRIPWTWALRAPTPALDNEKPVELPKHPLLVDWEKKTLRELIYLRESLTTYQRRQQNQQLDESIRLELTIAKDTQPGIYEIRMVGNQGLTNPLMFVVGMLPETSEIENNDPGEELPIPAEKPLALPVTINGQIMAGDVDRIRFQAAVGQQLVVQVQARTLIPFLADAVPGWVQTVIAIYDPQGREIGFADDHQYHPDPLLRFKVPATGIYELEIRDALYRGREDFVYRLSIGELPIITTIHPLGGRADEPLTVTLDGWNLGQKSMLLSASNEGILALPQVDTAIINQSLLLHREDSPTVQEREFNNTTQYSNPISLPMIVDGRIDKPGDVDIYQFQARSGDKFVASVLARRLGSPMDSVLRLLDAQGRVLAANDDVMEKSGHMHPDMGIHTHHADSHINYTIPADGIYYLQISDAAGGNEAGCSYRLKAGPPQPDYELRISPSSINLAAGQSTPIDVYVLRKDGYEGPIHLQWEDAPQGFTIDVPLIPAGCDHIRTTLTAPAQRQNRLTPLQIKGQAEIGGVPRTRLATACDDVMQAFLWRHLQPAQSMMLYMKGGGRAQPLPSRSDSKVIDIIPGRHVTVTYEKQTLPTDRELKLQAIHPPEGVTIGPIYQSGPNLCYDIKVEKSVKPGIQDNLILQLSATSKSKGSDGKERTRVDNLGYLRAVPIRIVEKQP